MRGNEFLYKMELIDHTYIEEAEEPTIKKHSYIKWGIIAACFALLALTAAAAISGVATDLIDSFTSRFEPDSDYSESGFKLRVDIEKIPENCLTDDIKEISTVIKEQYKSYKPYMSHHPGTWQKSFSSRSEAYGFISCDKIEHLPIDWEEEKTGLYVQGTKNGALLSLTVETRYIIGNIRMQFFSDIYTENFIGDITTGSVTTEYAEYSESFYTTLGGKTLHIISQSALESGYLGMDGYLTDNGVLHRLHIAYLQDDAEHAERLLHIWADNF